jgi:EmrB/QacA subfamily drug resistance transporter
VPRDHAITDARNKSAATDAVELRDVVSKGRVTTIMIGVILGMLLASIDQTVVGTAMPRVIAELGGLSHYAWVFTAYMLSSTVVVPIYGKLSDIYGRRPYFIISMVLFLLGSALSGLSQNMTQLILFRVIQGLGAGGLMPIASAIIGDLFTPAERGKWQGIIMSVFGLSTTAGPTLGGWLTDNWGWRWVFYINMPLGLLAIITTGLAIPKLMKRHDHSIDFLGALLLILGSSPLLLAFSWAGTDYPWGSPTIMLLIAVSLLLLGAFFWYEGRVKEPILAPSLFRNSIFSVSVAATFLSGLGMFGVIMYLPLFVQGVIGTSATNSGIVLAPMMGGFMVSSMVGGQIIAKTGKYRVLAMVGFLIAAFGMFMLSQLEVTATNGIVMRDMAITGLGLGVMMSLFTIVVQNAFPRRQMGQVTAGLQFFRAIGGTIGVAILGSVMNQGFHGNLEKNLPRDVASALTPQQLQAFNNPGALLSPETTAQMRATFGAMGAAGEKIYTGLLGAIKLSLTQSLTNLFYVGMAAMLLGLVLVFFLKEIPLTSKHSASEDFAMGEGMVQLDEERDEDMIKADEAKK